MRKLFIMGLCLGFLTIPLSGFADSKQKVCFTKCKQAKQAQVQTCIDTQAKPLSKCIQGANDREKQCRKKCQK